ncbi:uncharacterized protein LY89DRAFT_222202 [Mollisia scopiformis]|uniref:Uncharacterized protein n=1 Tax=Mollisia scopiformis TaxID=149040 RepID=A0A194WVX4_MOLSC|nr:uncharacterized protein LY89DRAFT_222202 [Mollisia scopiformis]KUJ12115.1 hypothetical protein LY89DRAFT_222202 [Mollisia scopiformis]
MVDSSRKKRCLFLGTCDGQKVTRIIMLLYTQAIELVVTDTKTRHTEYGYCSEATASDPIFRSTRRWCICEVCLCRLAHHNYFRRKKSRRQRSSVHDQSLFMILSSCQHPANDGILGHRHRFPYSSLPDRLHQVAAHLWLKESRSRCRGREKSAEEKGLFLEICQ